jgi:hypothetical protein
MARPFKAGLNFFATSCDISVQEDMLIDATGAEGLGILTTIYRKIYKAGFYATPDKLFLYSIRKESRSTAEAIDRVIKVCLELEIFDPELFKKYNILTSIDIQKEFFFATKRREVITIERPELLLIDAMAYKNTVNVNNNPINVDSSTHSTVQDIKEEEEERERPEPTRTPFFLIPKQEELEEEFKVKGVDVREAQKFLYHYQSNGWMVGKNRMVDWRASVGKWVLNMKGSEPVAVLCQTVGRYSGPESPAYITYFSAQNIEPAIALKVYAACLNDKEITQENWMAKADIHFKEIAA